MLDHTAFCYALNLTLFGYDVNNLDIKSIAVSVFKLVNKRSKCKRKVFCHVIIAAVLIH